MNKSYVRRCTKSLCYKVSDRNYIKAYVRIKLHDKVPDNKSHDKGTR